MKSQKIISIIIAIFLISMFLILTRSAAMVFAAERQDFKVTNVFLKADGAFPKANCPKEIIFRGAITTDGAGTVKYVFVRSDGASSPVYQLNFEKAGTKEIETSWALGASYKGFQSVKILSPNEVESNRETGAFALTCIGQTDAPSAPEKIEVFCPTREVRAEVTTTLPDPWWQTPQINSLQSVAVENIGGVPTLVCKYRAYGTTVGVMRRFPEGKANCEAARDHFVCW